MKITFTNISTFDLDHPLPASKFIPEWYKNTRSYLNDEKKPIGDGTTAATIKRCMPVLDAISSGYIIKLPVDVYVSLKDMGEGKKEQIFEWPALNFIGFHPIEQAPEHPLANSYPYPKFINPWSIQTPKGYSTLFIQPLHRESVFTIFPGIVDTDTYTFPTNFPFVMNDPTFEGYIKEGTPMVQAIPIKRDKWISEIGNQKDLIKSAQSFNKLSTRFFDKYKNMFWSRKEYT